MKVLVVVPDLDLGGVTSACISMCKLLQDNNNEVKILNMSAKNECMFHGFKVTCLSGKSSYWKLGFKDIQEANSFISMSKLLLLGIIKKALNRSDKWLKLVFSREVQPESYDIVIAYKQCYPCYTYALWCVNAKCKIAFVHGVAEYSGNWVNLLPEFHSVAYVSDAARIGFEERFSFLKDNSYTVYNLIDKNEITKLSHQTQSLILNKKLIKIVTISRISNLDKGTDRIPRICKHLKDTLDIPFHWYVIGNGNDMKNCTELSATLKTDDVLTFVGALENPYPILSQADFSVLPTKTESYGIVVAESLALGVPAVVSFYPALSEIIEDGKNGLIAEQSVDSIAKKIEILLRNKNILDKLKENCQEYAGNNDIVLSQIKRCVK